MAAPAPRRTKEAVLKDFRTSEIVDAAERVIGEVGYADASMDRIAREAGVAKGTLYLYFKNKDALLTVLYQRGHERGMKRMQAAVDQKETYTDKVRALVQSVLEYSAEQRNFYLGLYQQPQVGLHGTSVPSIQLRQQTEEFIGTLAQLLEEGVEAGEFHTEDPQRTATFLYSLVMTALVSALETPTPPTVAEDSQAILDLFFNGISRRSGS